MVWLGGGCLGPDPGGGWGSDGGGVSRPRPKGKIGGSGQGCVCPGPHPAGWPRPTPGGVSRPTPSRVAKTHTWGVSRPRPKGKIGGSGQGCVCPGPGGCIPTCTRADTPPSRWLLLWVVCILLECILVRTLFSFNPFSYLSSEKNSFWQ